jgi:hypothetical protein
MSSAVRHSAQEPAEGTPQSFVAIFGGILIFDDAKRQAKNSSKKRAARRHIC